MKFRYILWIIVALSIAVTSCEKKEPLPEDPTQETPKTEEPDPENPGEEEPDPEDPGEEEPGGEDPGDNPEEPGGEEDEPGGDIPEGDANELECTNPPASGNVDMTKMTGYAEVAGVTGGSGATAANILHFDNGKALQEWLVAREKTEKKGDSSPVTIWMSGTFKYEDGRSGAFDVKRVSNLTFYGTDGFTMDGVGMFLVEAKNILIRNIHFKQPKYPVDAVSMQECEGVWVDHCTFTSLDQGHDAEDGSCDITHGTTGVTVSWCVFDKTQKSCLVGHSNKVNGDTANDPDIRVTFHHNWFKGSSSRHPRVRFGRAHVYNNFYDANTTYGAGSACGARVLVEYNYFDGVQLPTDIATYPAKDGGKSNLTDDTAGYLYATQNVYVNKPSGAKSPYPLTNVKYTVYGGAEGPELTYTDFIPSYSYTVTPAKDVPAAVMANAGWSKLSGFAEAPVGVNNGGISTDPGTDPGTDPDNPPTGADGLSDGWYWTNNGATATYVVQDNDLTISSTGKWESGAQTFGTVFREVTGNFTATVRLVSYNPLKDSNQAVAGIMVIGSEVSATANDLVFAIGGGKYGNFRKEAGAAKSGFTLGSPESSGDEVVLKMERDGNKVKISYSTDGGATFGSVSSKEFTNLAETVKLGLAANSGDNSKQSAAVFRDFTVNNEKIKF